MKRNPLALKLSKTNKEIWKNIPKFKPYAVSNLGRVKNASTDRILKTSKDKDNYDRLSLDRRTFRVHQLVLLVFCGTKPKELETRHLNGDCSDNRLFNIKYGTSVENKSDNIKHNTVSRMIGSLNPYAVLNSKDVIVIKKNLKNNYYGLVSKLARRFKVGVSTIKDIKEGKTWKHI